jgi:hypothetical protein
MIQKAFLMAILMGFVLSVHAANDSGTEVSKAEELAVTNCQTTNSQSVSFLDLSVEKHASMQTLELAATSCQQCYVDHQVCIQYYSRPFCRQQLADCRETCN